MFELRVVNISKNRWIRRIFEDWGGIRDHPNQKIIENNFNVSESNVERTWTSQGGHSGISDFGIFDSTTHRRFGPKNHTSHRNFLDFFSFFVKMTSKLSLVKFWWSYGTGNQSVRDPALRMLVWHSQLEPSC